METKKMLFGIKYTVTDDWNGSIYCTISSISEDEPAHITLAAFKTYITIPWKYRYPEALILNKETRQGVKYIECITRSFGFYYIPDDGFLCIRKGLNGDASDSDNSYYRHLSWKQWRFIRHSIFQSDGSIYRTEDGTQDRSTPKNYNNIEDGCEYSYFSFLDFDGEENVARTYTSEREWSKGVKWFKWLRFFTANKIHRSVELEFHLEIGTEKGSWKGGTLGHGTETIEGETQLDTFKRYCSDHNLSFIETITKTDYDIRIMLDKLAKM